jgi:hypothetical protein
VTLQKRKTPLLELQGVYIYSIVDDNSEETALPCSSVVGTDAKIVLFSSATRLQCLHYKGRIPCCQDLFRFLSKRKNICAPFLLRLQNAPQKIDEQQQKQRIEPRKKYAEEQKTKKAEDPQKRTNATKEKGLLRADKQRAKMEERLSAVQL